MSKSNGVIRIGRKGIKKFAFGEDGTPFEVDIVEAWQGWITVDDGFRPVDEDEQGNRLIPVSEMAAYHAAAVAYVEMLAGTDTSQPNTISKAEALDFIARLREEYDELADFFRPKSRQKPDSPATSGAELRFSVEGTEQTGG